MFGSVLVDYTEPSHVWNVVVLHGHGTAHAVQRNLTFSSAFVGACNFGENAKINFNSFHEQKVHRLRMLLNYFKSYANEFIGIRLDASIRFVFLVNLRAQNFDGSNRSQKTLIRG